MREYIPYSRPSISDEEVKDVIEVLESGWLSKGPKSAEFEEMLKEELGVKYVVAVNSCTAALHLALISLGIGPGDEVITSPFTFCASANVIAHVGAKPVFVDIKEDDYCIDASLIEQYITPNTKAIMPVHYGGGACDMDLIVKIAEKHSLKVIEDTAHGLYARYKEIPLGTMGDVGAYSFYATKNITTGEGGALVTNNKELADKARVMSLHGMSKNAWNRYNKSGSWAYDVLYAGYKYNITDIQSAIGINQLKKLDGFQNRRLEIVAKYHQAFSQVNGIKLLQEVPDNRHAWHLYTLQLMDDKLGVDRDELIELLANKNVGTSVHFIPLHLQSYYQNTYGYKQGDFPKAEKVFEGLLSLPLYPSLTDDEVDYIIKSVLDILLV